MKKQWFTNLPSSAPLCLAMRHGACDRARIFCRLRSRSWLTLNAADIFDNRAGEMYSKYNFHVTVNPTKLFYHS